jgi:hypothetical protein
MIVILFIVLLIIILLCIYIKSKDHFQVQQNNIIKGNEFDLPLPTTFFGKTNIYLGKSIDQDYLTYDTQFKFEISSKENTYQITNDMSRGTDLTTNTIYLSSSDTMIDDGYNNYTIKIIGGTGVGQTRKIIDYDSATKLATVDTAWDTPPLLYSVYSILSDTPTVTNTNSNIVIIPEGTVSNVSNTTITLFLTDSNDFTNYTIKIIEGIGKGLTRKIIDYDSVNKLATVDTSWGRDGSVIGSKYSITFNIPDVIKNVKYNLFNGIDCPQQDSSDACFKRNSNFVYEALLSKKNEDADQTADDQTADDQTHKDETNMYWQFFDIERMGKKYIHYGDEVILKNLGKTVSYLCLCDTNPTNVDTCGTVFNIYCYDDLKDAYDYGKWIIIPKYFNTINYDVSNYNEFKKTKDALTDKNGSEIKRKSTQQYLTYNTDFKIKTKVSEIKNSVEVLVDYYIDNNSDLDSILVPDSISELDNNSNKNGDNNITTNLELTTDQEWLFENKDNTNDIIYYGESFDINAVIPPSSTTSTTQTKPNTPTTTTIFSSKWMIIPSKIFKYTGGYVDKHDKEYNFFEDKYTDNLIKKKIPVKINDEFYIVNNDKYPSTSPSSTSGITTSTIVSKSDDLITWSVEKNDNYDFYEDNDIELLKSKKIPIKVTDDFLVINSIPIDGKYIYLNLCNNVDNNPWLELECHENKFKKAVGTSSSLLPFSNFNNNELEMEAFNWKIEPITYNVNVHDTLFVKGSLKIGSGNNIVELTGDHLKYIKSMPYYFKDKICLKDKDETKTEPNCIEKHHIEMLNGSRPINIKSVAPAKPFKLYTGVNYTGRELRIGFNYENANNLPYLGDFNSWLNPSDSGKWRSVKIEGPYSAIIYSKPNFGHGDLVSAELDNYNLSQDEINAMVERETVIEDIDVKQYDKAIEAGEMPNISITDNIIEKEKINPLFFVVSPPGISDISILGTEWIDGIRSIKFFKPRKDLYELKCLENYPFTYQPYIDNTSVNEELLTANLCKNGDTNQQFYFSGEHDNKFEPDNYNDTNYAHVHFHRHPYDSQHEDGSHVEESTETTE